jgi:hypothetical protein
VWVFTAVTGNVLLMGTLATRRRAAPTAEADDPRPLACVVSTGCGAVRRRKDDRLVAVLSEFGWRAHVTAATEDEYAGLGEDRLTALAACDLVVCDLVSPARDVPMELAVAATRGVPVLALVPSAVALDGLAQDLLGQCRATVLRYARVEPHRVLHAGLLAPHVRSATQVA